MHIRFEFQYPRQKYDFPSTFGRTVDYLHYNADRILMDTRVGVRDPDRGNTVHVHPAANGIEVALLDIHTGDWDGHEVKDTFEDAVKKQKASFDRMYASLPSVPKEFEWARHEAAIVFWTTIAGPRGMFKRPMMLMSNNWMNKTWSWDHAINSLSLGYHDQDAAWEQFRCMFDFMSPEGMMPDMVSDEQIYWIAVKPPVHGWVFSKLRQMKEFSRDRLALAYDMIERWTRWWLERRDFDHNGLSEYLDGCDSGWDNSTAICMNRPPLETPDLQAFLILQMECLADIAKTLGRDAESAQWTARAKRMLDATVKILFDDDGAPRVRRLRDGGFDRDSLSLVTRLPMILGKRLPEKCRAKMIDDIKTKGFITDWGLASESVNSRHYHPDGYWKGPIWGPSTLIAVEGLRACGEDALADEISLKFCRLIMKSGFCENFDAKTGDPRRDPAYTWTASAFLVLAHELEQKRR
jgi:glycogen debranching enzyme